MNKGMLGLSSLMEMRISEISLRIYL